MTKPTASKTLALALLATLAFALALVVAVASASALTFAVALALVVAVPLAIESSLAPLDLSVPDDEAPAALDRKFDDRPTMPPPAPESTRIAAFEATIRAAGENQARLRNLVSTVRACA